MTTYTLHLGDCLDLLPGMGTASIDACVTDPPYELGFMGRAWDRSGIAFSPDVWREVLRVLKPGGYLVAFGGTRTYHRMACAIEDAGFEVRDSLHWLYGSGFPKNARLALKPAHEPAILARRPMVGTLDANLAAHGTGALNIDATRVGTDSTRRSNTAEMGYHGGNVAGAYQTGSDAGRWPTNVVLSHSPDCLADCANDCPVAELDQQGGVRKSGAWDGRRRTAKTQGIYGAFAGGSTSEKSRAGDVGTASRFFYVAKAPRSERDAGLSSPNPHPTVKPLGIMRHLVRLVTPPGGTVLDPFTGSGTTGCAAVLEGMGFIGCEMSPEYIAIAEARIAHWTKHANNQLGLFVEGA